VDACLKEGEIVAPTGEVCVRTLPRKQQDGNNDGCDDRFGVAKYAVSSSEAGTTFVFLCDDSLLDKSCGISDSLYKQAKKVCQDSEDAKVIAVHFSWLFDCISCATVMPAASYEPIAPRAKALWRIAAGGGTEEEDRGKKSQFY